MLGDPDIGLKLLDSGLDLDPVAYAPSATGDEIRRRVAAAGGGTAAALADSSSSGQGRWINCL